MRIKDDIVKVVLITHFRDGKSGKFRGRLVDPALGIDASVDAGDMAARRHVGPAVAVRVDGLGHRVEHLQPRKIKYGIGAVRGRSQVLPSQVAVARRRFSAVEMAKRSPVAIWQCSMIAECASASLMPGAATIAISSTATSLASADFIVVVDVSRTTWQRVPPLLKNP